MSSDLLPEAATLPPENRCLQKEISDFLFRMKGLEPDIGHIIVVYDSISCGGTIGMGTIQGIKDMKHCVTMLERYTETLNSNIPSLN